MQMRCNDGEVKFSEIQILRNFYPKATFMTEIKCQDLERLWF